MRQLHQTLPVARFALINEKKIGRCFIRSYLETDQWRMFDF